MPVVHAAYRCPAQHFGATQGHSISRSKHVINPSIVDGGLARIPSQVTKILREITIGLAIIFCVISEKIGSVSHADFQIQIAGNECNLSSATAAGPVNYVTAESPA